MRHGGDIYSDTITYDFSVNLNPVDTTEIVSQILQAGEDTLRHYPDIEQKQFREAIALVEKVDAEEIWGGNGASELLMAITAMINPSKAMLVIPCFNGYRHVLARFPQCEIIEYALQSNKEFLLGEDLLQVLEYHAKQGLQLLFLTNPNNPTGRTIPKEILLKMYEICKTYGVKIILDECFIRMSHTGFSMTEYIQEYAGLFIVNAYTKLFSIPGIRTGYVVTNRSNIQTLKQYLPEWNMSVLAQSAGVICSRFLRDTGWITKTLQEIERQREYLSSALTKLGVQVYKSDTVFLLCYTKENLYTYLKEKKILIRDCSDYKGLDKGFYRIAVKNATDNQVLIETLEAKK